MFFHNFKYSLKILLKNKALIFWTFAFPIILGTFFFMAFSDIEKNEKLKKFNIAVVNNEQFQNQIILKETFQHLEKEELFSCFYVKEEEANKLLEEDKIEGYFIMLDSPKIVIKKNGIYQTILKYVTEEAFQANKMFQTILTQQLENTKEERNLESFYANIEKEISKMLNENEEYIKDTSSKNLSYTMIEFYTLIAMAALYGGTLGLVSVNQNLANMTSTGKRVGVSPISKQKLIFSSVLASYLTQLIGITILFLYTIFILKIDYGNHFPLIILLTLAGCLAGLSLGIAIACIFKTNDNIKTGIILTITMLGCFLSGMMGITMKYIIDKNIPILNKINPANMITDGFYSLYYYDTLDRYYFDLISLLIFSSILIALSIFYVRRQKYDSI